MIRFPHHAQPSTRILKVYIKALMGFNHIVSPGNLNNTLFSPVCVLEMAPIVGILGKMYIPRKRNGWGASSIGIFFFFFFGIYYVPGIFLSVSHILPLLAPHITLVSSCYIQENKS